MNGNTRSCGCLQQESRLNRDRKQNKYDTSSNNFGILFINDEEFYFDLDDYEKIKNKWWKVNKNGYAVTPYGNGRYMQLSRFIMNAKGNSVVDHIDRNIKDNRKKNLRICTQHQNTFNCKVYSTNHSGYTGVSRVDNKWLARICINAKTINLGRYVNIEDAIIARLNAEIKYFGREFAPQRHLFEQYLSS